MPNGRIGDHLYTDMVAHKNDAGELLLEYLTAIDMFAKTENLK
jgi:hypothetical protein